MTAQLLVKVTSQAIAASNVLVGVIVYNTHPGDDPERPVMKMTVLRLGQVVAWVLSGYNLALFDRLVCFVAL